ncbi:hypothetical protein PAXRUDRAFT_133930 [Paxillus rubicundulus Ve08.2h10]|uniref:Uncharacterized protein n=1 Tax=Paxillus rubicundulus Ve08.2h10 TaxID=930991 RepID=A0A0D0E8J4_9AGAM|nr:hypothetical protein PAXRUDRAFT_133930 [Paxillus rubicundulus Ve08.2h10]
MSAVFSRTLTFKTKAEGLGADATLMLTFNDPDVTPGLYHDKFPVCWKVTSFAAEGPYSMKATYQSHLAFVKPQVEDGSNTIVDASTYKSVNLGDETKLTKDTKGVYHFSNVTPGDAGFLEAVNGCPLVEDIAIGFSKPGSDEDPTCVLYFGSVGHNGFVKAQFTPHLRAYITDQYQETQIIRGEVDTPMIWQRDLGQLAQSTTWFLTYNGATGEFAITDTDT